MRGVNTSNWLLQIRTVHVLFIIHAPVAIFETRVFFVHGHFLRTGPLAELVQPLHLVREEQILGCARTRSVVLGRNELHLAQAV